MPTLLNDNDSIVAFLLITETEQNKNKNLNGRKKNVPTELKRMVRRVGIRQTRVKLSFILQIYSKASGSLVFILSKLIYLSSITPLAGSSLTFVLGYSLCPKQYIKFHVQRYVLASSERSI